MFNLICRVRTAAEWCIYRGMTQSKAAQKAGISQAALSQTEKQDSRPQT
ncbi:helix-turn-helix transcriptional regulator [Neisseria sp. Marseille-Q6792]|nr:helix-turn-helix transcriptional regulator [Neisseria sp. Marseille-Q6792]